MAEYWSAGQVRPLSDYKYRCWTCRTSLEMVSSTLGVCPRCSLEPVAPIDFPTRPDSYISAP